MYTILILLSFLALVGAWYYWKKKPNKKYLIICIVLAFVFGGLSTTTNGYKAEEADEAASSSKVESSKKADSQEKASSESKVKAESKAKESSIAESKVEQAKTVSKVENNGINNNNDAKTIVKEYAPDVKVKNYDVSNYDGKQLNLTIKGEESYSAKSTLRGFWKDTANVWKAIKHSKDVKNIKDVTIVVEFPLEDTAGNTSTKSAISTRISGDKLDNLNAKNFNYYNVQNYADRYVQNSAFPDLDK